MLKEMYVDALLEIGQCRAERKEYEEAIRWYKRALEANELREDVHRGIMRCYFEAGRRPEAIAQSYRCDEMLERELNIGPSSETERLYEQIVGNRKLSMPHPDSSSSSTES
jgi:DNA-binding SARP family transcriptional activator